jgi:hypothetical protein
VEISIFSAALDLNGAVKTKRLIGKINPQKGKVVPVLN